MCEFVGWLQLTMSQARDIAQSSNAIVSKERIVRAISDTSEIELGNSGTEWVTWGDTSRLDGSRMADETMIDGQGGEIPDWSSDIGHFSIGHPDFS